MKKYLLSLGLITMLTTTSIYADSFYINPDKFYQDFTVFMNKQFKEYSNYLHSISQKKSYINNGYLYEFDVPGIDKKNINIKIENNFLYVKAFNKDKSRKYEYSVKLPDNSLIDKIKASVKNGVLKVIVPIEKNKTTIKVIPIK